jgi:hypothetical protein
LAIVWSIARGENEGGWVDAGGVLRRGRLTFLDMA